MLRPKWLTTTLSGITFILLVANLAAIYSSEILHHHHSLAWRFYFDKRLNFPFFFSLALLFINLYFIFKIAQARSNGPSQSTFWKILGVVFILFTLDEAFDVHYKLK